MTLDKMIADALKRSEESEGEEKIKASAEVDALRAAKEAGYQFTQSDLNAAEKKRKEELRTYKERVESLIGDPDEFAKKVKDVAPAEDGETPDGEPDVLSKIFGELKTRDEALERERNERLSFQRELKLRDVYDDLDSRFKDLGLQEAYAKAAREFVEPRLGPLMDRVMEGEDVSEDLQSQAERLKELSGVWFEAQEDPEERVRRGVPPSPKGGEPRQLTDEERLARADSVF